MKITKQTIDNENFVPKVNGDVKYLIHLANRFMKPYYVNFKFNGEELLCYKIGQSKPDKFHWYQLTINILPLFISEKINTQRGYEITQINTGVFVGTNKQISIMLLKGRIDGVHDRWDNFHPSKVLNDYVNHLDRNKALIE